MAFCQPSARGLHRCLCACSSSAAVQLGAGPRLHPPQGKSLESVDAVTISQARRCSHPDAGMASIDRALQPLALTTSCWALSSHALRGMFSWREITSQGCPWVQLHPCRCPAGGARAGGALALDPPTPHPHSQSSSQNSQSGVGDPH